MRYTLLLMLLAGCGAAPPPSPEPPSPEPPPPTVPAVASRPTDAAGWAHEAAEWVRAGDLMQAGDALKAALDLAPERVDLWLRLGRVHIAMNQPARAARALEQAALVRPAPPVLEREVLRLALAGGDDPIALRAANRMLGAGAAPGQARLLLASIMIERDDLFGAARHAEAALDAHPQYTAARLLMATILARVGRRAEAEAHLRLIPTSDPKWPNAQRLFGLLALHAGEPRAALTWLKPAYTHMQTAGALTDWIRALLAARQLKTATRQIDAGLQRWPNDAGLRFARALRHQAVGDEDAALKAMIEVLEIAPQHTAALNYVGYSWADEGRRLPEAEAMIRRALINDPDDPAILDSLGWVLYRRNHLPEALKTLQRARVGAPKVGEIIFHVAVTLWATGAEDDGRRTFAEALKHTSDPATRARLTEAWARETKAYP